MRCVPFLIKRTNEDRMTKLKVYQTGFIHYTKTQQKVQHTNYTYIDTEKFFPMIKKWKIFIDIDFI